MSVSITEEGTKWQIAASSNIKNYNMRYPCIYKGVIDYVINFTYWAVGFISSNILPYSSTYSNYFLGCVGDGSGKKYYSLNAMIGPSSYSGYEGKTELVALGSFDGANSTIYTDITPFINSYSSGDYVTALGYGLASDWIVHSSEPFFRDTNSFVQMIVNEVVDSFSNEYGNQWSQRLRCATVDFGIYQLIDNNEIPSMSPRRVVAYIRPRQTDVVPTGNPSLKLEVLHDSSTTLSETIVQFGSSYDKTYTFYRYESSTFTPSSMPSTEEIRFMMYHSTNGNNNSGSTAVYTQADIFGVSLEHTFGLMDDPYYEFDYLPDEGTVTISKRTVDVPMLGLGAGGRSYSPFGLKEVKYKLSCRFSNVPVSFYDKLMILNSLQERGWQIALHPFIKFLPPVMKGYFTITNEVKSVDFDTITFDFTFVEM